MTNWMLSIAGNLHNISFIISIALAIIGILGWMCIIGSISQANNGITDEDVKQVTIKYLKPLIIISLISLCIYAVTPDVKVEHRVITLTHETQK